MDCDLLSHNNVGHIMLFLMHREFPNHIFQNNVPQVEWVYNYPFLENPTAWKKYSVLPIYTFEYCIAFFMYSPIIVAFIVMRD